MELYGRVRHACHAEVLSQQEAARRFGIHRIWPVCIIVGHLSGRSLATGAAAGIGRRLHTISCTTNGGFDQNSVRAEVDVNDFDDLSLRSSLSLAVTIENPLAKKPFRLPQIVSWSRLLGKSSR